MGGLPNGERSFSSVTQGGSMVRALIPPAGVHALRSPQNFAKIEARAAPIGDSSADRSAPGFFKLRMVTLEKNGS